MPLRPLSEETDYTFPVDQFDVRGWTVKTGEDDAAVGRVDDLLLDDEGTPRYLDLDLDTARKDVLLPIGQARVDEEATIVWIPGLSSDRFDEVPEYTHEASTITADYERKLDDVYAGAYTGRQYYDRPEYRVSRPRMRREGAAGEPSGALTRLADLDDFRIAHDDPDPRHWDILAGDGSRIGEVVELIVDTSAGKVRYLDCALDQETLGIDDPDAHCLIPIGYARLDEDKDQVIVDVIDSSVVAELPRYTGLPLGRDQEDALHSAFTNGHRGPGRYRHPRYSPERLYEPRRSR